MEVINNTKLAIALLNDKKILVSNASKNKTLILMQEGKIIVKSDSATYTISQEDFVELFKNDTFYLYEIDNYDANVASQKDIEYYSWRHK